MTREELIKAAIGVNESYRCSDEPAEHDLEIGFLYGTAEMVVSLTIDIEESYHDLREEIAARIDKQVAVVSYPLLPANGYKE